MSLGQPAIILVEAQLAENIGAAARAMLNFGLDSLRLVSPRPEWPNPRAVAAAAGADVVLREAGLYRSTFEAMADCQHVYAASSRARDLAKRVITPEQAGRELRQHEAEGRRTAVLFGPERTGLLNDDVALCDTVITVALNPGFSSLNLAQAVLLVAYEWSRAGARPQQEKGFCVADKAHVMSFLLRLEKELDACGFLRVSHMRATMVRNLRSLFTRAQPTDQEIRTLHGVLTELVTRRLDTGAKPNAQQGQ